MSFLETNLRCPLQKTSGFEETGNPEDAVWNGFETGWAGVGCHKDQILKPSFTGTLDCAILVLPFQLCDSPSVVSTFNIPVSTLTSFEAVLGASWKFKLLDRKSVV